MKLPLGREATETLPLSLERAAAVLRPAPRRLSALPPAGELWLGVHLPHLALEALSTIAQSRCLIIVEQQGSSQQVVAVADSARRAGIRPGMSLAAAAALNPEVEATPRDHRREQALLDRLAVQATRFTPRVNLAPPDGLLLEIKGSLHLFKGAAALSRAFMQACAALGVAPLMALAPMPLAALAGARAGTPFNVTDRAQLSGHLSALPLTALRWPQEVLERLIRMGVHTIGQAMRLPRAGFARRFGVMQLTALDRLTGRAADPRPLFRARERFRRRLDLAYESGQHTALLAALGPVFQELGKFLDSRQCGITQLDCLLHHRQAPPTRCGLRLAAPAADAQRLQALWAERLATFSLPEPVRACELRTGQLLPRAFASNPLWQPGEHGGRRGGEAPELIEQLRARLGTEAVYGLRVLPGHRPETAWAVMEPGGAGESPGLPWAAFRRPLWLLPGPQPLHERDGLPRHRGRLRLLGEPERVESGWWDGGEIARDYYTAVDIHGVRLWIFRERAVPHRWFLHGIFG